MLDTGLHTIFFVSNLPWTIGFGVPSKTYELLGDTESSVCLILEGAPHASALLPDYRA